MDLFNLPHTARVSRVIPKNAFDSYTTPKQKKMLTDLISKITWTHKLSPDTVNLEANEIREIQIFWIELKVKEEISRILEIIDKSIPYNIVFVVEFDRNIYISISTKHAHPGNADKAVVDWTFKTDWFTLSENSYTLSLKKNLDFVYHDFCRQLSNESVSEPMSFYQLVNKSKSIEALRKEIKKLKSAIDTSKQFNKKLELNLKLKEVESQLDKLLNQ